MIRVRYLYKFLEDESKYFTSLAFFVVLFTVTLFIELGENPQSNLMISVLQSGSLLLLILCFLPLIKKLRQRTAKILQIFDLLLIIVLGGLLGYLWYQYKGIVVGLIHLTFIIIGYFHAERIKRYFLISIKDGLGKLKKDWLQNSLIILTFFVILITNLDFLYKQRSLLPFIEVNVFADVFSNLLVYFFIGYLFWLGISILIFLSDSFEKNKVRIKKFLTLKFWINRNPNNSFKRFNFFFKSRCEFW